MSEQPLQVILTHEFTDFDALASLLGAALLYPGTTPVLPRHLNRNVSEFVHLYMGSLPFTRAQHLPRRHVVRAILVDTRSANAVKGMDDQTEQLIIDHHSQTSSEAAVAPAIEQFWERSDPNVGANTTLLVEQIRLQQISLTPVQATLLALGIYEDTGNLTYRSTTHRDAACVAWLLEPAQQANLEVISRFLRHPLSEEQRRVYQQLMEESEHLEIAGHQVVIAAARAVGFKDEISTLAHKMRSLFEPDALLLIVDLGDRVQVVARSSVDGIDVGAVARALGGGGHARAAAAPIRGRSAAEVRAQILQLLREQSRPAFTVRQLMTLGRPQIVHAHTSIERAIQLMRRYGHEGFPVLESRPNESGEAGTELVGILTRQEADRALSHGLGDQPVRRFMRAGRFTVTPDDPVTILRQRMVESGWGQLPVVNEAGELIGIVTRTDLIKQWGEPSYAAPSVGEQNRAIDQRLRAALPPAQYRLLQLAGREVDEMGYTAYVVGGFVRDLLLGDMAQRLANLDLDIVIEGDAIRLAQHLQSRYGGRIVTHRRFGTAKWLLHDAAHPLRRVEAIGAENDDLPEHLDFVTARTEFYTEPSALPTVERSSIKLDLHRRDFTLNTLAISLHPERWGELLDFYNGLADLRQGWIRVLHSLSFVDDPTRILRAVRYEQRFDFAIETRTLELLTDAVELVGKVSPTRIRHELERILQERAPEKALARLDELGVLAQLHPQLQVTAWVQSQFQALRQALAALDGAPIPGFTPSERLYWGILIYPTPPAIDDLVQERLHLRGETVAFVRDLRTLHRHQPLLARPDLAVSQVVQILDDTGEGARFLFGLLCADPLVRQRLAQYEVAWRHLKAELSGRDLQALGIRRGPMYGQILDALRAARLDDQLQSRDEEVALALRMAAQSADR